MKLNILTLFFLVIFGAVVVRQASGMPWTPYRIAGLAIAAPALLLLILARIQLGRAFSVRARATDLVTSGIYSRIRNPIYVFGSLFALGLIIWTGRPVLLLALAVIIPLQIYRSRKEAEILQSTFGDQYLQYKKKTWF